MNRFGDIDISFKRLSPVYGFRSEKLVSIEEALERIVPQIDELPYYIKIAKRNCHFPSEHGLTRDQSAAIYIYTMEWGETTLYRVLNQALRSENRQELKVWFPFLKLFDTALNLLPTVREVIWRGVPIDIGKNFKRDQTVTWWSINSCSSSPNVIKNFLNEQQKSTLFLIEAISGKKVSGYTEYENEEEIILPMGTQLRVKGDPLDQTKGSNVVHLIEIADDGNDDCHAATAVPATPSVHTQNPQQHIQYNEETTSTASSATTMASQMSNMKLKSSADKIIPNLPVNARWEQHGVTVAGGNGQGENNNQLHGPWGLFVNDDDDHTIFIADYRNHRIMQWKRGDTQGQIVAGGNGQGNQLDQLDHPSDVLIDKETNSFIIADNNNRRVVRWSRRSGTTQGKILIDNIKCWGLAMDEQRNLYVSDVAKNAVRRYEIGRGDKIGTVVAGGNGKGSVHNQLNEAGYFFVDRNQSLYVSDWNNHRVMKWDRGATKGVVVAGGQGSGTALTQLSYPIGIFVDALGNIYVAEGGNDRVTRWSQGSERKGTVVVGRDRRGSAGNQFNSPGGLFFDKHGNLYVVDVNNNRVQYFNLIE